MQGNFDNSMNLKFTVIDKTRRLGLNQFIKYITFLHQNFIAYSERALLITKTETVQIFKKNNMTKKYNITQAQPIVIMCAKIQHLRDILH